MCPDIVSYMQLMRGGLSCKKCVIYCILEQMVKKWMESFKDSKAIADALDALKSFICSPFLYGDHVDITHWTTKV